MSDIRRLAGLAGLALAAMMLAAFTLDFVMIGTNEGPPQIFIATLSADLVRARQSGIWPIEIWLYSLQIIPFTVFILGVRSALRAAKQDALADVSTLAATLFMALHTLHNLAILTVVTALAPGYVPATAEGVATEAVARGLLGLAYAAFLPGGGVGGALLVAALAAFAVAQRRSRASAPWSGRLAGTAAVLTAVAYAQYVIPAAFFVALPGFLAFIGWTGVVSVGLLRSAPRGAAILAPQPA